MEIMEEIVVLSLGMRLSQWDDTDTELKVLHQRSEDFSTKATYVKM